MIACVAARWSPEIGDPTVLGWVTVPAYLACAALATWAGTSVRRAAGGRLTSQVSFWFTAAGLLVLLGLNKQLDLQSALTEAGRCLAREQGWYEERRHVQRAFVAAVAAAALGGTVLGLIAARRHLRVLWPAVLGLSLLLGFVAARAASFHHIDAGLGTLVAGMRLNNVAELSGIALTLWGSRRARRAARNG